MNLDLLHGNCGFRIGRHKAALRNAAYSDGFRVEEANAAVSGEVMGALSGSVFFPSPLAIIVSNPTKDTEAVLEVARQSGDDLKIICIQNNTIPKSSKLLKGLKSARVFLYQNPTKPWELEPHGVEFGMSLAKDMGLSISKSLMGSLVSRVGAELPTLYWEIRKAATLAQLESATQIEAHHIKKTMAPISEVSPDALIAPLESLSTKRFLSAALRIQDHAGKDPTMWACAILSKRVLLWLAVATAVEKGVPLEDVALRLNKNVWYLKNQVLNPAKRWGSKGCVALLSAFAASEVSVRSGAASPFNQLVCEVVEAIRNRRGHR